MTTPKPSDKPQGTEEIDLTPADDAILDHVWDDIMTDEDVAEMDRWLDEIEAEEAGEDDGKK